MPIAVPPSSLASRSRSSSIPRAIPMSPSAVLPADRQGNQSVSVDRVMAHDARCSRQPAPNAARLLRYPSNRAETNPSIAAIASVKLEAVSNPLVGDCAAGGLYVKGNR